MRSLLFILLLGTASAAPPAGYIERAVLLDVGMVIDHAPVGASQATTWQTIIVPREWAGFRMGPASARRLTTQTVNIGGTDYWEVLPVAGWDVGEATRTKTRKMQQCYLKAFQYDLLRKEIIADTTLPVPIRNALRDEAVRVRNLNRARGNVLRVELNQ